MSAAFTPAWLAGEPRALSLLEAGFRDPEARARAVARAGARSVHPAVLSALAPRTEAQRASLDKLSRPGTVAIVTGQQMGLFGGPLFTLYKAASAIANAQALERETGTPCVPLFWMQDEDHDFEEIATCPVLGPDGALHEVTLPARPGDEGLSVAARTLGPEIETALDTLEAHLGGLSEVGETMALLRRAYTPDATPASAFRALIEAWFGEAGLLVLDPWTPPLMEAAAPLHARCLEEAERISQLLLERTEALQQAGFSVQVHVRPGAPLGFFHPGGPSGPRFRVEPDPAGWKLCGTDRVVPDKALREGFFSTSALLRPILQDSWLPTVAYVGGPGEIAYFAQLPPLYQAFGLPMPLVVPRARFLVVDETSERLLGQLQLRPDDLRADRGQLLARLARARAGYPDPAALEARLLGAVHETIAAFAPQAEALDKGLGRAAEKTGATMAEAASRLVERYRRTLAQQDEVTVDRLDRLRARLYPGGEPQERVHSWPWYAARHGLGFASSVLEAIPPWQGDLRELRP